MNWNLSVNIDQKSSFKPIGYDKRLLLLGSCFSEHIGHYLETYKFQSVQNPFGILYNPKSIGKAIQNILDSKVYVAEDLMRVNERWLSLDHHSKFSDTTPNEVLKQINTAIERSNLWLTTSPTIIITFGTAFYYRLDASGEVVGNCHKIPANQFTRAKLTVKEITDEYASLMDAVYQVNKNVQWIFTVSPVRHWKDGAMANNLSKSTLNCAIHDLVQNNSSVHYFPSYEIMMDELRDYRFYKEDMVHPNDQAVKHIWKRFVESSMDPSAFKLMGQIEEIKRACEHRPFNFQSNQHQSFIKNTFNKIKALRTEYPYLDFGAEENKLIKE